MRDHDIKNRKVSRDKFYTPRKLAKELISLVPLKEGDLVLDPCRGKGAFYDNFPPFVEKEFCEIDMGRDFFHTDVRPDWAISNPPYSIIEDWLKMTLRICKKGFAYLLNVNKITPRRIERINRKGFYLTKFHMFKIFEWYGMSCFVVFEKTEKRKNIITFNREVWRQDEEDKIPCEEREENYIKVDEFL